MGVLTLFNRGDNGLPVANALTTLGIACLLCITFRGGLADGSAIESAAASLHAPARIAALGRIEPRGGVRRIAGPSRPSVVIAKLQVDEGDSVEAGQVIAVLDTRETLQARLRRLEVEFTHTRGEYRRHDRLFRDGVESASEREQWSSKVQMLEAELERVRAEADKALVRAPIRGQVIDVHARTGERVGADGILELAGDEMVAIAEVYEIDVGRVRIGQRAVVASPALSGPLSGTVQRIGRKIGKLDALGVDPVAAIDARVVEVEVGLDDDASVSGLTNLQVEVSISP